MKFGKSYLDALSRPDFPEEWRKGAIEYKSLKKLINGVVAELEGLGLSQSVLHELLDEEAKDKKARKRYGPHAGHSTSTAPTAHVAVSGEVGDKPDEPDYTPPDGAEDTAQESLEHAQHARPRRTRRSVATESDMVTGSPAASPDADETDKGKSSPPFALRALLRADYETKPEEVAVREAKPEGHDNWVHGSGGRRAHAAYELVGTPDHPVPQIRITVESPVTSDASDEECEEDGAESPVRLPSPALPHHSPSVSSSSLRPHHDRSAIQLAQQVANEAGNEADSEYVDEVDDDNKLLMDSSPQWSKPVSLADTERVLASQETLDLDSEVNPKDFRTSPRWHLQGSKAHSSHSRSPWSPHERLKKSEKAKAKPKVRMVRRKQVVIPLLADAQFLDMLTQALVAVQSVQSLQRKEFIAATQRVTQAIGQATSPTGKNQQDLYAWREIFQLWTDAQIFESTREADAGELPPDESERRLHAFADELHQRGWLHGQVQASRVDTTEMLPRAHSISATSPRTRAHHSLLHRTLSGSDLTASTETPKDHRYIPPLHLHRAHSPTAPPARTLSAQSTQALQDFMALNVTLLDVKKYQQVNLEAARKILKKHDKRTALSAGTDLKQFMASSLAKGMPLPDKLDNRSQVQLPPPPDPVAIANAVAGGHTDEPHRMRLSLRRHKKPVNVAGLNLGGTMGRTPPSSTSPLPLPYGSTLMGSSSGAGGQVVHTRPPLDSLIPASTASTNPAAGPRRDAKDPEESLAHKLFSLMSSQLLPILPAVDEVSCAICTDVAWRPIRLDCGHLFCMRCMVKLQKQGWKDCPLCRAPDAVRSADERNLDEATGNVLKVWFPREVREKEKENELDRKQEQKKELGVDDKCIIS